MVTLLNITVLGLQGRLGAITARREVNPSLLFVRALQNADSTALPRGPMRRSMWATSLPSPTRDSPTRTLLIFATAMYLPVPFQNGLSKDAVPSRHDARWTAILVHSTHCTR